MNTLPKSKLVKMQQLRFEKLRVKDNDYGLIDIIANVRFDDQCGNGHNTFSITGTVYKAGRRTDHATITRACIHDDISKHFPKLRPLIKWHLVSNTMYNARLPALMEEFKIAVESLGMEY